MKKQWWHNKVAYQIYPKSFYDSNGDGIGDIRGIIEKLDYLKDLGIDIIWISPVYPSPLKDQGYDISDYYGIDPRFGTMEDMDELLAETKKRNMYILMDLVINHCSDQHEWFQKALRDPYGKYGKYFYFEKGHDGKLPTNWRSYFGGPVWEPVPGYDSIANMLNEAKGIGVFLEEMKNAAFKPHEALTIGEVFNMKPEETADFIGDDGHFSSQFEFDHVTVEKKLRNAESVL